MPALAQANPPTLTGESLFAGSASVSNTCTSFTSGGTVTATYSGTAFGPYPGSFTETLTATLPPNGVFWSDVFASFTITAGAVTPTPFTTVTGTKHTISSSSAGGGCGAGAFLVSTGEGILGMTYQATINTPTGSFHDQGTPPSGGVEMDAGCGLTCSLTEFFTSSLLATTPVGADLSITKSGSPNPVVSGNQLTYTITVTNNGPQNATGVTVTDPLPATVHFNSVSSTQGTCTRSTTTTPKTKDGTVTCGLGALSNGASATVTIVVTATQPGMLTNTASVSGDQTDPNPANNSATATTIVLGA
jgi:uncharacterized repeat protein (TIGR01451 family)